MNEKNVYTIKVRKRVNKKVVKRLNEERKLKNIKNLVFLKYMPNAKLNRNKG